MVRQIIKKLFGLYDINDLQAGATCGCCGKSLKDEVVEKDWPYGVCKDH